MRTEDGRVIPINEIDFGDFETQTLYEIAADFPDSFTANRFLQIYRDSGWEVPEFLQLYLDVYQADLQRQAGIQGIKPQNLLGQINAFTEENQDKKNAQGQRSKVLRNKPFDLQDVAPYGTLNFSDESLNTIKALFEREGLPLPEGLESVHPDEDVAPSDKSDIMESPDAQEEDGSGKDNTGGLNYQATEVAGETVIYRRVQGGDGTNSSRQRISVNADGSISILNKESNLSISIDNGEHSTYFRNSVRGKESTYVVEFEVPKWFDVFLKAYTIPQENSKTNPRNMGGMAPKRVDLTKPGMAYELPSPWIKWLEEYATNARIIQ